MMISHNTRRGFTLIELLVVVLIIGILAAVALPQYNKAVLKSRMAALKPLVHGMFEAQTVYKMEHGSYATKFEELSLGLDGTPNSDDNMRTFGWGKCAMADGIPYCTHTASGIGYSHNPETDKEYCLSEGDATTGIKAEFCKTQTKKSSPSGSATVCDSSYKMWEY